MTKKRAETKPEGLRLEYVPLGELQRAPANPKRHDEDGIQASISHHGYVEPIVLDDRTGRIVAGHGRLDALQALKAAGQDPPARVEIGPDGEWRVQVLRGVAFPNDAEAQSYLLASNALVPAGGWDDQALAAMLADLQQQEVPIIGWSDEQVEELIQVAAHERHPPMASNLDDAPDPPAQSFVRTGDCWTLGDHRLLCGDSTKPEDVARVMGGGRAATLVTSPPYWTGQEYDDRPGEQKIAEFMACFVSAWKDAVDRRVQIQTGHTNSNMVGEKGALRKVLLDALWASAWGAAGWNLRHRRIWGKSGNLSIVGPLSDVIDESWEFVLTFYRGGHNEGGQERVSEPWAQAGIWSDIPGEGIDGHPCPFPVEMARRMVLLYSRLGDIVADPFIGSGTTLIACEQTGRRARALDMEPRYVEVCIRRWEQATGKTATLDGRPSPAVAAERLPK